MVLIFLTVCTGSSAAKTIKEIPTDTQVIQEMTKGKIKSTVTQEDERLTELKHWKYGQKSITKTSNRTAIKPTAVNSPGIVSSSSSGTGCQPLTIYFPSETEIRILTEGLIKLGYLKKATSNQQEFMNALNTFRHDYKIKYNSDINLETFKKLQSQKKQP